MLSLHKDAGKNSFLDLVIMTVCIPDSHPALSLTPSLKEFCDPFLKKHNLNYFQLIRVNKDGSTALLTNRAEFTDFAIKHAIKNNLPLIYSSVKKEVIDNSSYYFLWEPNLPVAPVAMVRNEFNITNGLTFVERFPTHYYMIAFAAPAENHAVLDFYLNNMDQINNFLKSFKAMQKPLLQQLEKDPLILPPPLMDENLEDMLLKNNNEANTKIPVFFAGQESYVTPKEYECLTYLPFGLTAKQIAKNLNISFRTVEKYFERIKTRTGCASKQDLIELLS